MNEVALTEIILLGVAQDAGVPQANCECARCAAAQADSGLTQYAACLGILDHGSRRYWMVDATPDFKQQLHLLKTAAPGYSFAGIFLTHAHMGHYTGLMHVGKEAMHTNKLPVYATEQMADFLRANAPWKQLVEIENIAIETIAPGQPIELGHRVEICPVVVPHRSEYTDTAAYVLRGPEQTVLYCPDIDDWGKVDFDLNEFFGGIDLALVDGSFFSGDELPGRDMSQIPHPTIQDSVQLFQRMTTAFYFIHLNHTNPVWDEGPERAGLAEQGFGVGAQGQRWGI